MFREWLRRASLSQKLTLAFLCIGLSSITLLSLIYYRTSKAALLDRTFDQLTSIRSLKKMAIEQYFISQKHELEFFASSYTTKLAYLELKHSLEVYGSESEQYKTSVNMFGGVLSQFRKFNEYRNLWLVDTLGLVVYTSVPNDYTYQNILLRKDIHPALRRALDSNVYSFQVLDVDYISFDDPQHFILILIKIRDDMGKVIGNLISKINTEEIEHILTRRSGMGSTGESYLVSAQGRMRTESRFLPREQVYGTMVTTVGYSQAMQGRVGTSVIKDYRGVSVLSSYDRLSVFGATWVILSEIDLKEAMAPIDRLKNQMFWLGILLVILIVGVTLYLADRISSPLVAISKVVQDLGKGKFPDAPLEVRNSDEIGLMILSINQLVESLNKKEKFAMEIGRGFMDTDYKSLGVHDNLGNALLDMRDKLVKLRDLEKIQQKVKTLALLEGSENERKRISQDLHDGIGQMLTALKFKIQEIEIQTKDLQPVKHLLDDIIQEIRRISSNLMPKVLLDYGLEAALLQLSASSKIPMKVKYQTPEIEPYITQVENITLFRIAQEALNNALKYSGASELVVQIVVQDDGVKMDVLDNGTGFDLTENQNKSHGIRNMIERAKLLNGEVNIHTEIGKGTRVEVWIPFSDEIS